MKEITLLAPAKINLTLDITGKRPDGYHLLSTVMQSVALFDTVLLKKSASRGIVLKNNLPYLPVDERNLAHAAARKFFAHTNIKEEGLLIEIEKKIPVGAGLGGGSANAAAVLRGLNVLYGAGLTAGEMRALALPLGADVPFCVEGGVFLAAGIGEELTPIPRMPEFWTLLLKPSFSLSTAAVFKRVHLKEIRMHPDTKGLLAAAENLDLRGVAHRLYNVLEDVIADSYKEILKIKGRLLDLGALGAVMSGSGPTVFGIFPDEESARFAEDAVKGKYFSAVAKTCLPVE